MVKWENTWIKWGRLVNKLPWEPLINFVLIELLTGILQLSKFSKRFHYSKNLGVGHLNRYETTSPSTAKKPVSRACTCNHLPPSNTWCTYIAFSIIYLYIYLSICLFIYFNFIHLLLLLYYYYLYFILFYLVFFVFFCFFGGASSMTDFSWNRKLQRKYNSYHLSKILRWTVCRASPSNSNDTYHKLVFNTYVPPVESWQQVI